MPVMELSAKVNDCASANWLIKHFLNISSHRCRFFFHTAYEKLSRSKDIPNQITYIDTTQHNECGLRLSAHYTIHYNRHHYRRRSMWWLNFRMVHIPLTYPKPPLLSSCELSPFRLPHYTPWSFMQSCENRRLAVLWSAA